MARKSRKAVSQTIHMAGIPRLYKTAVYARLSVEDTRNKISDSIGTQKALLVNYLRQHPDLQLYDIYEDINYSGTNFKRPGFARMIADIQAGLVNCVIVKDLSRFGRNFEETGRYVERIFPFLQVRFIAVGDNYDSLTASPDDTSLIVPLKNLMNEIYAHDISKKVKASKKIKKQRGEFCGSFAPYGYIKEGSKLIIDDEAAKVVCQIFSWSLDCISDAMIAQRLNDLKVLPPSRYRFEKGIAKTKKLKENSFWYKSAIKRILINPVYTGIIVSGKCQPNILQDGRLADPKEDEALVFKDAHPAIISLDVFEAVNTRINARQCRTRIETAPTKQTNIFKGLIYCGDCGKHMTRKNIREQHTFICSIYDSVDKNACTRKPIREVELYKALCSYLQIEIDLSLDIEALMSIIKKKPPGLRRQDFINKQISVLQNRLVQNKRYGISLHEDYKDGLLTQQDYRQRHLYYSTDKYNLQNELESIISKKPKDMVSSDHKWIAVLRLLKTERKLSAEMLSALIERIDIYDGPKVEITLKYRDNLYQR